MRKKVGLAEGWSRFVGEPFLLRPWDLARLTDWQVEHLYVRSAQDAADAIKKGGKNGGKKGGKNGGRPNSAAEDVEVDDSPPQEGEAFVRWWRKWNGGGREEALQKHREMFPP